MNGSTATSIALSFLLVAGTAAVFYQPDRPPPRVSAAGPKRIDPQPPSPARKPQTDATLKRSSLDSSAPRSAKPGLRRPESAFATVQAGETLADLAARVYGSADLASVLFQANRDQLERLDDHLAPGTVLRTPEP